MAENNELRSNKIIVIFGKKGFGKTCWIKDFIWENPKEKYIIVDHFLEHDDGQIIYSLDELLMYFENESLESNKIILRGEIDYEEFFEIAKDMRGWWIIFDEIDKCCSPSNLPEGLESICQYGRHLGVNLICAARRPHRVHRMVTSQADEIILFQIKEPRDLKYISEYCGNAYAEELPNLPVLQFVKYE